MIKNKLLVKILIVFIFITLCCNFSIVKAEALAARAVIESFRENVQNASSSEEINAWVDSLNLNLEDAQDTLDQMEAYYGNMNHTAFPEEEYAEVEKIIAGLESKVRELSGAEQEGNLDEEDMMDWSFNEIRDWLDQNDPNEAGISDELKEKWIETIQNVDDSRLNDDAKELYIDRVNGNYREQNAVDQIDDTYLSPIYKYPSKTSSNDNAEQGLDDLVTQGNNFLANGQLNLNENALQNFSGTMFNILLAIGVVVAVIVGAVIGLKLMISSVEEQAEAKKLLVPYVVGCVVVFGAFGIWKLIITLLQGI